MILSLSARRWFVAPKDPEQPATLAPKSL